jgi:MerR family transcriptional regulator, copper efflux regulator
MNVAAASRRSGLPPKTIRYYEEIGLVSPSRRANGYRDYGPDDIERLAFLRRARGLGFSIEECRALAGLDASASRTSQEVREIAMAHRAALDEKRREIDAMSAALDRLIAACPGDQNPHCAILDGMAGRPSPQTVPSRPAT